MDLLFFSTSELPGQGGHLPTRTRRNALGIFAIVRQGTIPVASVIIAGAIFAKTNLHDRHLSQGLVT
jgi:hypothetical protein